MRPQITIIFQLNLLESLPETVYAQPNVDVAAWDANTLVLEDLHL